MDYCDCDTHVIGTILTIIGTYLTLSCLMNCKRRVSQVIFQDKTWKTIVIHEADRIILKTLKNGYESEKDHEE